MDVDPAKPARGALVLAHARTDMLAAPMSADAAPGRTFAYWLAQTCKAAREAGQLNQRDIPAQQSRVSRFETHGRWPENPEGLVQAYAQALGIRDSRQLWDHAMSWWLEHGQPPAPIQARQVPGIPEGRLLQHLRETRPNDWTRD